MSAVLLSRLDGSVPMWLKSSFSRQLKKASGKALDSTTHTAPLEDDGEFFDDIDLMEEGSLQHGKVEVATVEKIEEKDLEGADTTTTMEKPAAAVRERFMNWACTKSFTIFMCSYGIALTLTALMSRLEIHLSLVILSLLPAICSMSYMQQLYKDSVLRSEMLMSFFLSVFYMSPVVIVENLWYYAVLTKSNLETNGISQHSTEAITWSYRILSAFVQAFLVAGMFEEGSKYLAIRRLKTLPHANDPPSLLTYSLCIGVAFGTVEDLFIYAFAYGVENTVARALLSVPLHIVSSLLMGCSIAEDRFSTPAKTTPWYRAMLIPILIHGTFDFINFSLSDAFFVASLVVEVVIILAAFAYYRYRLVGLLSLRLQEVNIHEAIKAKSPECNDEVSTLTSQIPTRRSLALVITLSCMFCAGMLCFLYLW